MQSLQSRARALPGVVLEPSDQHDAQLVRASQQGKQEAFALLVRNYQRRIFQLSLGMLQDEHDASECTQEAFEAAWQGLPSFRDETRFSIWLYRIAYLCGLRQLGRRKREHARYSVGRAEQVLGGIRTDKLSVATSERHDRQTLVQEQVEQLPLTYRTVLILCHLHKQTYEEIASIISMSLGTVKTRLFRARALLKERLVGTAPLVTQATMMGTSLTENEEAMPHLGHFPFREEGSIACLTSRRQTTFRSTSKHGLSSNLAGWSSSAARWPNRRHGWNSDVDG